jgi:hypothetical protein
MRNNRTLIRAAVLLLIALLAVPIFAARGTADFTRFVAIGDSYGAGLTSGSLNMNHQPFSWPAVLARQAGAPDFQQPLVTFPGIGSELQLVDVTRFPPTILPATGNATPINLNLPRPYNNLSVPGANVTDVITITGKENRAALRSCSVSSSSAASALRWTRPSPSVRRSSLSGSAGMTPSVRCYPALLRR